MGEGYTRSVEGLGESSQYQCTAAFVEEALVYSSLSRRVAEITVPSTI